MARLFISAAHKSSGKTILSLGLCAAMRAQGLAVQPFKKGPDYIDPLWLSAAAGRPCRNLDHHTMSEAEIAACHRRHAATADISIIEGNKGLHDGVDPRGRDSGAALARLLRAPVILVIDAGGITRGIAPLLIGYRSFDPEVVIAGVILNKVAGARHEAKLRAAVEHYTGIPVLGAVHRSSALEITERHLGLIPANEAGGAEGKIAAIAAAVAAQVDLPAILAAAGDTPALRRQTQPAPAPAAGDGTSRRVGIASDAAFGFYYPEDMEILAAEGFIPVPFDTLRDQHLPRDLDGLIIGGGFPEAHMEALEANGRLRAEIRAAVAGGLPVYAECGGMMYLSRGITWHGRTRTMVGALAADAVMNERPQGRGYVRLRETGYSPWAGTAADGAIAAHEFHYAGLENLAPEARFAYRVLRGHGIDGRHDGMVIANTLASFSHLRGVGGNPWPRRFATFMRQCAQCHHTSAFSNRWDGSTTAFPAIVSPSPTGAFPSCPIARPSMPATHSVPAP